MKQRVYFFALGFMVLGVISGFGEGLPFAGSSKPIEELLLPDGTLDLSKGYTGNIEASGYTWYTDSLGKPHFVRPPLSPQQNENWSDFFAPPGCDGQVRVLQFDISGNLYIGGTFSIAGTAISSSIAMWDGSMWNALGEGLWHSISQPSCTAIAIDANGVVYVGGYFTSAGGFSANSIAKWNPASSTWSNLGDGLKYSAVLGQCNALQLDGSGKLYVGGWFNTAGGISAYSIAVWDIATSSWSNPFGAGIRSGTGPGTVYSIQIDENNHLYVGGSFNSAGGTSVNNIAKWDGSSWSGLGSGFNTTVLSLLVESSTSVYAGGEFTSSGGSPVNYIAKWNGMSWSNLGPGLNSKVRALLKMDSDLYAGGEFTATSDNSVAMRCVGKWDGANWSAIGQGFTGGGVYILAKSGSILYAGGFFTTSGTEGLAYIAQWSGSAWIPVCSAQQYGMRGESIRTLAAAGDAVYVGGLLWQGGTVLFEHVGRWNEDANTWENVGNADDYVNTMLWDGTNLNLYVGGFFNEIGNSGPNCNCVAKYDGTNWSALGTGRNDAVFALAMDGNGDLYAGGLDGVGKWNGSTWTELGTIASNDTIYALAVIGTTLYVGGKFTQINGVSANYLAKWDGSSWSPVDPNGMDGPVRALAVYGTDLIAGGTFTTAGGTTVNYIARWDGSTWHAFGNGMNGPVYTLNNVEGILYVGGGFTQADGNTVNGIASWNGATWTGYGDGIQTGKAVYALTTGTDGLYIGGNFRLVGNKPSIFFGKYNFSSTALLAAKIFLEGAYDSSTDEMTTTLNTSGYIPTTAPYSEDPRTVFSIPTNVTDWVLVQLRSTPTGSPLVSKSVFLRNDGRLVADDGTTEEISLSVPPGTYYIIIKHRNHLAVMSATGVILNGTSATLYDFTTGSGQFYGTGGAKELESGVWGMIVGDVNNTGHISASDRNTVQNATGSGYLVEDLNLDGEISILDTGIIESSIGFSGVP